MMRMPSRRISFTAVAVSAGVFAACGGSAMADTGSASDSDATASVTTQSTQSSQPFLAWGDSADYVLAPDGDFSAGLGDWTVTAGADLTPGSEPWADDAGDGSGGTSLALPAGSSATTPTIDISADEPTIRLFDVDTTGGSGTLDVSVSFSTGTGTRTVALDSISGSDSWAPSPAVWILVNRLARGGTVPVQFTFASDDDGYQIDDLYIDPWGRGT